MALKSIARLRKQYSKLPKVYVGHSMNYAIYVHEDLEAHHNVGIAKFLETALRRLRDKLADMIVTVSVRAGDPTKGMVFAGTRLLRESQLLVPVDTQALKISGYVAKEDEHETVHAASKKKGEMHRATVLQERLARRKGNQ